MVQRIFMLGLLLLWGTPSVLRADPALRSLFPQQAELFADSDRLSRLELSPEVLSACRGDLADLRVFDRQEREVPFLVDNGEPREGEFEVRQSFVPNLVQAAQQTVEQVGDSGERRPSLQRETYELAAPAEPSQTAAWDLVVGAKAGHFVRRVGVVVRSRDGSTRALVEEQSIFRLQDPLRERLRLALPPFEGKRVVVTLEGEEGAFLEPTFRFESSRSLAGRGSAVVALPELSRQQIDGKTLVEVARPRGLAPDALRLETTTGSFHRNIEVWDEGPGAGDEALGGRTLFRVQALATLEDLEIPLAAARGDRLRLLIEDGDSPPLEELLVNAVVRRPALLFALPGAKPGFAEPAGTLRFGGGRAYRPHYDLARLPPSLPAAGVHAEVAEQLYDAASLGEVHLGPIVANPHFDPTPVLAFAHRPGSGIDSRLYEYRRQVTVTPSPEGLSRLQLTAEDLAKMRPDLADLRIVDGDSQQWAYLLERDAAAAVLHVTVPAPTSKHGSSSYHLSLPVASILLDRIVLDTSAPFFDRAFELRGKHDQGEISLARGRLARRIGDPRPLTIDLPEQRVEALELRVEDGDDAPLEFSWVTVRAPLPELYFAAPAGNYSLLLGKPDDRAPHYELERVRDVVLAVASETAVVAALEKNPEYRTGARLATDGGPQQVLLWGALALAVVVLTGLTLRLARGKGE